MAYINEFPHTRNYDQDLGQLICMYKKLSGDYDTLVQIYEIVKKDINDITIEQLQKWLDDGTLENIINQGIFNELNTKVITNVIYSESDFETYKDATSWRLGNDITITKNISQFTKNKFFDLNGYKISLSNDYTGTYIFPIGIDVNFNEESQYIKNVFNGYIDCNSKNVSVFHIALAWRLWAQNLKIYNCTKGLCSYTDEPNGSYGAECYFNNISIYHTNTSQDTYSGILIRMGDSVINNVNPVDFYVGIENRAGSNIIQNCHPWGHPKTSSNIYPVGSYMKIGITCFSQNTKIINCISDTFEPLDTAQKASYANGGIGIFVCGNDIDVINCYTIVHSDSNNTNHIGYYFADTSPETSLPNYLQRCSIVNSHISLQQTKNTKYSNAIVNERPIQMVNVGFNSNTVLNDQISYYSNMEICAGSSYFINEFDFTDDFQKFIYLPVPMSYKIMVNQNVLHGMLKEKNGTLKHVYMQPYRNIYCTTLSQVQELANNIIADQNEQGGFLTSYIYTAMYYHDSICDLLAWNSATRKFYYVKNGQEVTY